MTRNFVESPRGIGNHKHVVASFYCRQCRKSNANLSDHTRDNQLFLTSGFNGLEEIFIVPGVELTAAFPAALDQ